jgi:hypothetical protein
MASAGFMPYRPPVNSGAQSFTMGADGNMTSNPRAPAPATPLQNQFKLYNSGVAQNASDYDSIMAGYRAQAGNRPPMMQAGSYTPQQFDYSPTKESTSAIANLRGLSENGGYSEADQNNLRERGISPIRSIYASAQRNVDRNKALQGGYSPNYGAVTAKMAREMSDTIGNRVTDVNAGLAQNIAQNRLQAAPQLASATAAESALRNEYGARNTQAANDASQFNLTLPLQYGNYNLNASNQGLEALRGMTSLYGTTPAMTRLFGDQAMDRANFEENQSQNQSRNNVQAAANVGRYM